MDQKSQYMALMSEIIAKQSIILGPNIAILKAHSIPGLVMDDQGKVIEIKGEPAIALQKLINEYVELAGMIVKNTLGSIFEKYPDIKKIN